MTDPRKTADDAAFERELAEASRAYRAADELVAPPPSMDDAIRAAARRAVRAAPRSVEKPWLLRFSKPLSVAAVLVLTASLLIVSFEERPELAPPIAENVGKIALPSPRARVPAETRGADAVAPAPRMAQEAPAAPPAAVAARRMELAPVPDRVRRADQSERQAAPAEANIAASAPVAAPAYTSPAPPPVQIAAAPMPAPAVAPPAEAYSAENVRERRDNAAPMALAKKEAAASPIPAPAVLAPRSVAGVASGSVVAESKLAAALQRAPAPAAAPVVTPKADSAMMAPPASAVPALKDAGEPPEAWLKRIIELRREQKAKEADEELARFRKRYPDFVIPPELKPATGSR